MLIDQMQKRHVGFGLRASPGAHLIRFTSCGVAVNLNRTRHSLAAAEHPVLLTASISSGVHGCLKALART